MKRLSIILALVLFSLTASAERIFRIDIQVQLNQDGSAHIVELWDLQSDKGTEWYLVKNNLGDIAVSNLRVRDINSESEGAQIGSFVTESGNWDVNRSLEQKRGRCGLHYTDKGVEICWGLGEYGFHSFEVSYDLCNMVKSADDYDYLHFQFISPGLSSSPEHVCVNVSAPQSLTTDNTRAWGFGYDGRVEIEDSVSTTADDFGYNSSVILLLRFDKGIFNSASIREGSFEKVLDRALEGASFADDEDDISVFAFIFTLLLTVFLIFFLVWAIARGINLKVLGVPRKKDVEWYRGVPFDGNLLKSRLVLQKLGMMTSGDTLSQALILRMVQNGNLVLKRDGRDKLEIMFGTSEGLDSVSMGLYNFMKEASGSDEILQSREFSRWSSKSRNIKRVGKWFESIDTETLKQLNACSEMSLGGKFSEKGQAEARKVLGFKKFLSDFTLVDERLSSEAALWNDYLVFGALFGIADKVSKELADIDPKKFENTVYGDPMTARTLVIMSRSMSHSIIKAGATNAMNNMSRSGLGGGTSFGGGGGFSGGGFGGGSR